MAHVAGIPLPVKSIIASPMPYQKVMDIAERIRATSDPGRKIALLEELRKLLDVERERLKAETTKTTSV